MPIPVFYVNTFTDQKHKGNPATVCLLYSDISTGEMQALAKELAVPVTAFIRLGDTPVTATPLRYFTTVTEIPACGHGTLASAAVMLKLSDNTKTAFQTTEGVVIDVKSTGDVIVLTYPKYNLTGMAVPENIVQSLNLQQYVSAGYCAELETLFIELDNPSLLRSIQPDFGLMTKSNDGIIEVVITSVSDDSKYDFLLRSFCPWIGIDEDPVTGSVHSILAEFWKQRLGRNKLRAYQASNRGGEAYVTAFDDKVELGGKTLTVDIKEMTL